MVRNRALLNFAQKQFLQLFYHIMLGLHFIPWLGVRIATLRLVFGIVPIEPNLYLSFLTDTNHEALNGKILPIIAKKSREPFEWEVEYANHVSEIE